MEKILAYMVAGTIGVSILAFFAVIIATAAGVGADNGFSQGAWPMILMLPLVGLPIGFVLVIILLITSALRQRRR